MFVPFCPRTVHRTWQAQIKVPIALKLHNQGEFVHSSKFSCRTCSVWTPPCKQMRFWMMFILCIKAKSCFSRVGTYLVHHTAPTLVKSRFLLLCLDVVRRWSKYKEGQSLGEARQDGWGGASQWSWTQMMMKWWKIMCGEKKQDEAMLPVIVKRYIDKTKCVTAKKVRGWQGSLGSGEIKPF